MRLAALPYGLITALLLTACSSDGERPLPAGRVCEGFAPGTGVGSSGLCSLCTMESLPAAIDGEAATPALLRFDRGGSGQLDLRTVPAGNETYAAGREVGVVIGYAFDASVNPQLLLNTYLDGVLQESFDLRDSTDGVGGERRERELRRFSTLLAFDALELAYRQGGSTNAAEFEVYELCSGR